MKTPGAGLRGFPIKKLAIGAFYRYNKEKAFKKEVSGWSEENKLAGAVC